MPRRPNSHVEGVPRHNRAPHRGVLYTEGVSFHSPGSRHGKAAKRTLGYVSHNAFIPRRGFTNERNDIPTHTRPRNATTSPPLCNAFGVWGGFFPPTPRVRRERRLCPLAATLGFGIQPLRGKETMACPANSIAARATRRSRGSHRVVLYAEGVTPQSPGSRRGEAAERTLGYDGPTTRVYPEGGFTNDGNNVPPPT